ncbi:hypothetical protein PT974_05291 [Cladobotryum mycophilum]|uniref:Uncharacterized protein n=1 Tax=Cladobotryum mycophilum TaxID=491253 RepID=A0ABR0SID8_9HYPO
MAYQRIRLFETKDLDRLYPPVCQYVQQASLAESVTEIAFRPDAWYRVGRLGRSPTHQAEEWTEPGEMEHDGAHTAVRDYIAAMGLSKPSVEKMIRIWDWKKRYMLDEWKGPDSKLSRHSKDFALTATTVLLSLCPNIVTLYVGETWRISVIQEYFLRNNYGLLPRRNLQKLKQVEVITGSGRYPDDPRAYGTVEFLDHFQAFHRLPSIESVVMEGVQSYQADRYFFVPRTGNMTKIHIQHADMSSAELATIISIPKELEELRFSLGGLWSTDGGHPLFRPGAIGRCLYGYKDTLRVLDLDINYHVGLVAPRNDSGVPGVLGEEDGQHEEAEEVRNYGDEYLRMDKESSLLSRIEDDAPHRSDQIIGSLHDFKELTHLSIGLRSLLGPNNGWRLPTGLAKQPPFRLVDILPPNLEYLCIYSYTRGENEDIDKHVEEFMAQRESKYPLLNEVKGIDETVPDVKAQHPAERDMIPEEELWERPKRDFAWVEVMHETI